MTAQFENNQSDKSESYTDAGAIDRMGAAALDALMVAIVSAIASMIVLFLWLKTTNNTHAFALLTQIEKGMFRSTTGSDSYSFNYSAPATVMMTLVLVIVFFVESLLPLLQLYLSLGTRVVGNQASVNILAALTAALVFFNIINWLYYALCERSSRQATVCASMFRLRVQNLDGGRINFLQASIRHFLKLPSRFLCFLGINAFFFARSTMRDKIARTQVVKLTKQEVAEMPLNLKPLVPEAIEAIDRATRAALASKQTASAEHLLKALLQDETAKDVIVHCCGDVDKLETQLDEFLVQQVGPVGLNAVIQNALFVAHTSGQTRVDGGNLVACLYLAEGSYARQILIDQNISRLDVLNYICHRISKLQGVPVENPEEFQDNADQLCKIVLHNDDYTTMEFVISVLDSVFALKGEPATAKMLEIHRHGKAEIETLSYSAAQSKLEQIRLLSAQSQFPLRCTVTKSP